MYYPTSTRVRRKGQTAGNRDEIGCGAGAGAGAGTYRRAKRFSEADP
jgi:hypothetical protein